MLRFRLAFIMSLVAAIPAAADVVVRSPQGDLTTKERRALIKALDGAADAVFGAARSSVTRVKAAERRAKKAGACPAPADTCAAAVAREAGAASTVEIRRLDAGLFLVVVDAGGAVMGTAPLAATAADGGWSSDALARALTSIVDVGSLVVECQGAPARVLVDGAEVGPAPASMAKVAAGRHTVSLVGEGGQEVSVDVVVQRAAESRVRVALPSAPPPPATPPAPTVEAAPPASGGEAEVQGDPEASAENDDGDRALRLAVYELELSGIDPRVGKVVNDSLVAELRKLDRVSVIGMDEVQAMLDHEAQKAMAGCDEDSCLSEIADALGVDGLVVGSLAAVSDQHVFGLRRIDQRQAKVLGSVSHRLEPAGGEEFLAVIGPSVEQLFPTHSLRAGSERGVSPEMALLLNPPPLPTWVFWSALTTTGAATGTALVALAAWGYLLFDYRQYVGASTEQAIDKASLEQKALLANVALVGSAGLVAVTALLAASTGAVAVFTDWSGAGDALDDE